MKTLREIVTELIKKGRHCNCDLDNWQPQNDTGHSQVCRIDAEARRLYEAEKRGTQYKYPEARP